MEFCCMGFPHLTLQGYPFVIASFATLNIPSSSLCSCTSRFVKLSKNLVGNMHGMSHLNGVDKEFNIDIDFQWGKKIGVGDFQFYQSFTYDGVDYSMFDCVYMWREEQVEPDIGVIVKIWETPSYVKKVKVVWFFRPSDISNSLGDDKPLKNEIFLASGEGKGLANLNSLLAIAGKCNVVCTSKNKSNPLVSDAELRVADFIFCRTFDVGTYMLSDKFPDRIAGIKVECFYNKKNDQKPVSDLTIIQNSKVRAEKVSSFSKSVLNEKVGNYAEKIWKSSSLASTENQHFKKRKLLSDVGDPLLEPPSKVPASKPGDGSSANLKQSSGIGFKAILTKLSDPHKSSSLLAKDNDVKPENQLCEVTRRSNTDTKRWFKQLDIVWQALDERVDAKMIDSSIFSSPHIGKAFVIFKSKIGADAAIQKLSGRCLMLSTARPLIAYKRTPTEPDKAAKLVGHLELDRTRVQKQRKEKRDAVATSHFSQSNNIEYDLAVKWCCLQEKTDARWNALNKKQAYEINELKSYLKYTPNVK